MLGKSRWIGLLLTVVFLALAFQHVDPAEIFDNLTRVDPRFVLPAALLTLAGYGLRTVRWRIILADAVRIDFASLFAVLMIGFATNNVLPARLGEIVRAALLRRRTGLRKTFSLATIFLERLFDGLVLVALLALITRGVLLAGFGGEVQALSSLLFLGATAGLLVILVRQSLAERVFALLLRPLPRRAGRWAGEAFGAFLLGLRAVRPPAVAARTLGVSLAIWACEGLSYYCLTYAFDFPLAGPDRVLACGLLLVFVNLGIMIPSAPGYVGTFQFFAAEALAIFRVPRELALSLAIVSHAMQYLLVTAIGAYFVVHSRLPWASLAREREVADEPLLSEPPLARERAE